MEEHSAFSYLKTIERLIINEELHSGGGISVMHEALVRVYRFGYKCEYEFSEAKSAMEKLKKLVDPRESQGFDAEGMCEWSRQYVSKFIKCIEKGLYKFSNGY